MIYVGESSQLVVLVQNPKLEGEEDERGESITLYYT